MPPVNPVIDKLEDVAEPLRAFYELKDGKYHIQLSAAPTGFVPAQQLLDANTKVIQFRDNNIALTRERDELLPLKQKFEGIDPDAARTAIAAQAALAAKGVTKPDDIATMIQTAVSAAVKPLQDQVGTLTTTNAAAVEANNKLTMRTAIGEKFTKAGGVPEALNFILGEAQGKFIVEGGSVKAAQNVFSADRPGEPLSIDEWVTKQTKDNAFAFKPSGGGGAAPVTPGAGGGTTIRPDQVVLKNPTPQELGQHADAIAKGKMKIVEDAPAALA